MPLWGGEFRAETSAVKRRKSDFQLRRVVGRCAQQARLPLHHFQTPAGFASSPCRSLPRAQYAFNTKPCSSCNASIARIVLHSLRKGHVTLYQRTSHRRDTSCVGLQREILTGSRIMSILVHTFMREPG